MRRAVWRCRDRALPLGGRTLVMGILNVTPDSFSDSGRFFGRDAAVARGVELAAEGADLIDVGGESTRPGSEPVAEAEERSRVVPVVEALVREVEVPVSVDTRKAAVAEAALSAGAVVVNDVSALRADPRMAAVAAGAGAGVVLMHMLGEPATMQDDPRYDDVVGEVAAALGARARAAEAAGIAHDRIVVDPGIGFGKTREHNVALLAHLRTLRSLGYPVLVGPSRKSFLGGILGLPAGDRLEATAAALAWCVAEGAEVVRVHDVRQMVRVARTVEAIRDAAPRGAAPDPAPDRIVVRGLGVFGYHGVHPRERERGQRFVVDLEAHVDLRSPGRSDRLGDTLDYSEVARRAAAIVAKERYDLIETLAERLAGMMLEYPQVRRAVVRVAKPEALSTLDVGDVSVRIERAR